MRTSPARTRRGSPGEDADRPMPRDAAERHSGASMERASPRSPFLLLGLAGAVLVAAHVLMPADIAARALVSAASGTFATAVAAGVVLASARRPEAWSSARPFGLALLALALVQGGFLVVAVVSPP